jgi:hypothetical protein
MCTRFRFLGLLAIAMLFGPQPPGWCQKKTISTAQPEQERRSFAQNLARAINAAEANYFQQHQVYASWDNLMGLGYFSPSGTKWASPGFPTVAHALYGSGPEIVPGWRLRLHLSNKEKTYDVSIEDVNDLKCGYAVTTDERGLIRQGKSIACP